MTITLPSTACSRADRAARLAHRRASAGDPVAVRVPAPRVSVENRVAAPAVTVVPAASSRPDSRRCIARNAMRDDEWAAQGMAFVVESGRLRERAVHHVATLEAGGPVDPRELDRVDAVLRGFRSYDPFLGEHDRALNRAARRRLVLAVRAAGHVTA